MADKDQDKISAPDKPKGSDPEYILKGVQAFGVGVALFGASIAVAYAAIGQASHDLHLVFRILAAIILFVLSIVISTFGSLAVALALEMTGLVKVEQPFRVFYWGAIASWIVVSFVIANSL